MVVPTERWGRRAAVVRALRRWFERRRFIEVDTPVAISAPAPEVAIDPVPLQIRCGPQRLQRALQTSPELAMKRLLAAGLPRIFQIAAVFRDGDHSRCHRPEFRLLEWYRAHADYRALWSDCAQLLRQASLAAGGDGRMLRWGERQIDIASPPLQLSVEQAFRRYAGFSLLDHLCPDALRQRLGQEQIHHQPSDSWEDMYGRVYCGRVEPALARLDRPLLLTEYPLPLAALARACPGDGRVAERFELLVAGMELANGFGELTCPREQRARFVRAQAQRAADGKAQLPLDERFLAALAHMPPAAGIALGLERLLMLVLDAQDIDAVWALGWDVS